MPYYVLTQCPPDKLEYVAELCKLGGLEEAVCITKNVRQWDKKGGEMLVKYDPNHKDVPLMVQTHGTLKVDDPDALAIVKGLIGITGADPDKIYDHPFNPGKRDGCLLTLVKRIIEITGVYHFKRYDHLSFRKPHPSSLFE